MKERQKVSAAEELWDNRTKGIFSKSSWLLLGSFRRWVGVQAECIGKRNFIAVPVTEASN